MNLAVRANFFTSLVMRRRWIVAAGLLFIAAGSVLSFGLELDPSLESRFLRNNPRIEAYRELKRNFGSEPLIAVVLHTDGDAFTEGNIERIRDLTKQLRTLDGIASAASLSDLAGEAKDEAHGAWLKRLPLVKKLLAGRNDTAVITLVPKPSAIAPSGGIRVVKAVRDTVHRFTAPDERAFVTGALAMQSRAIELSRIDLMRAIALVAAFTILLFGWISRNWRAVAGAFLVQASAITGACGLLALFRVPLSQFSLIAIPILAAIALQDSVHLLEHFLASRREGIALPAVCRKTYAACARPCFWTTATTVIGFAALFISDIEQIRSIALVVVIGAPIALGMALLIMPALLAGERKIRPHAPWSLRRLSGFTEQHASAIVLAFIALVLLAGTGLVRAHTSLDFPRIFGPDVDFQQGLAEMDEHLLGGASFEVILSTTDGSDFTSRDKLMRLANVQTALSLTTAVTTTISPLDAGITAYALEYGPPDDPARLAANAGKLVQDMRSEGNSPLQGWLTSDLMKARVHVRVRTDKARHYDNLMTALRSLRKSFAPQGIDISWSGFALLYKEMERRMLSELIASFGVAFAGILLFMIVIFRSWRWGLLSMVPNLLPVAVTVGLMGWAGVGFSLGLVILPAVGLGLVVDDTIHVLWGVRRYLRLGMSAAQAVERVLATTGRALVLSTVVLIAGFGSLAFSPFISNNRLAIFMPLLLVLALAFDLVGVPAILFFVMKRRDKGAHDTFQKRAVHTA